jgi:hypothetical protein
MIEMNDNSKINGLYSWPVIILALVFFWPVGLFLIFKRFSVDKKAAVGASGKGLKKLGIVLAVIGAISLMGWIFGSNNSGSAGGCFFLIGGVLLIKKANKLSKEAESTRQYLAIIVNGNVRQLDNIAAATGKPYDVVKADIQKMIQSGYLKNAYINENTREVVLPVSAPVSDANTAFVNPFQSTPAQPQAKVVACPCCGANNTIYGETGECEYCGSPIK